MRLHDADDDSFDQDPDAADLADAPATVKCLHCGRSIHEDADLCPYCRHWQTDDPGPARKPLWFVLTVILLVGVMTGALWVVLALLRRG